MALDPKAQDPNTQAALALHRFGLGPRAGSIAAIASDPRGALIAELARADAGRIAATDLMTSSAALRAAVQFQQARREMRQAAAGQDAQPKNAQQNNAQQNNAQQNNAQQNNAQQNNAGEQQKGAAR